MNYAAHIVFNGVRENLGRFATPEDAHQAYLEAAEARFGEWARAGERREFSRIKKTRGPPSEESRAKISATLTGRKLPPFTEAHRAALSASLKGQKRGPLSEEHRALLSKIKTGKKRPPMSDEWRAAIGAAQLGKKRGPPSPETRMKRRVSMLAYFQRKADADIAPGES